MNKILLQYIPHGVNSNIFKPFDKNDINAQKRIDEIKKDLFQDADPEFIIFFNNRNIRRKMPGTVIASFKGFVDTLPDDKKQKAYLIMHTQPVDQHGTDLIAVTNALGHGANVVFSANKVNTFDLACLYNIADITINLANAEGFGLSTAESLMCGTPIIATVTGGLQDQMRFEDENGNWINFNKDFPSNHSGKYKTHAEWAFPVFPATQPLVGSPPTPYIFNDEIRIEDAIEQIKNAYDLGRNELKRRGLNARKWMQSEESGMSAEQMSKNFINGIDATIENFTPRERFKIYKI